jgi:hypothetical protein
VIPVEIPKHDDGGWSTLTFTQEPAFADTGGLPWNLILDWGPLYWTNLSPCMDREAIERRIDDACRLVVR